MRLFNGKCVVARVFGPGALSGVMGSTRRMLDASCIDLPVRASLNDVKGQMMARLGTLHRAQASSSAPGMCIAQHEACVPSCAFRARHCTDHMPCHAPVAVGRQRGRRVAIGLEISNQGCIISCSTTQPA